MATLNRLSAKQSDTRVDGRYSDGAGLYLRVDDNGRRRRWVYRVVRDGKAREFGLGSRDTVTLKEAREKRDTLAKQVASGIDPRVKPTPVEQPKTFGEVANFVIERKRAGWSASSLRAWEVSLHKDAKELADIPVADVTLAQVKAVVLPIEEREDHIAARRTLSRIEKVLAAAIAHDWRERANVASWDVFEHILAARPKADRRHPALDWRDAPAAFARMLETDTTQAKVLALIALTALRLGEASDATWSEIDFGGATWTIPAERMKVKGSHEPHVVPLSRQALELLAGLKENAVGALIFPGQNLRQPISRMAVWKACLKLTDDRATTHGWRATFRSWAADHGVDREVAESALAHTIGGVEGSYNRAAIVERRRPVMSAWASFLAGEASAAVIQFRRIEESGQ